jgi:hypothetical protein
LREVLGKSPAPLARSLDTATTAAKIEEEAKWLQR